MSKFYIEIDSLILIFTFFIIYFNQLGKTTLRKFKFKRIKRWGSVFIFM